MTLNDLLQTYRKTIPPKDLDILIEHVLGQKVRLLSSAHSLSQQDLEQIKTLCDRRIEGEPVARIIGQWEFWSLPFYISPDTLIPRPDTETLIDAVLKSVAQKEANLSILDLGTGSGCILLSLLSELTHANGTGIDISKGALDTAQKNAEKLNLQDRCSLIESHWCENLPSRTYDLIVSNPPYIETDTIESLQTEVRDHDPKRALDGGTDGLEAYRIILQQIPRLCHATTKIFLEIGYNQKEKFLNLSEKSGFYCCNTYTDLAKNDRVVELIYGDKYKKNESQG